MESGHGEHELAGPVSLDVDDAAEADDQPGSGFRFSIIHLLYLTTLLAAAIAFFEEYAAGWLMCVVGFWAMVVALRIDRATFWERIALVITLLMFLSCMGLPVWQPPRDYLRNTACKSHVRLLSIAMMNYQSSRLNWPAAYLANEDGTLMHSWRVLILPHAEYQSLYDQYDITEPWDGPNNKKLVDQIDNWGVYFCPSQIYDGYKTPFKLVTGPGTAFDGANRLTSNQIPSPANTISIIEDVSNPVCWMQPKDLTVAEAVELFDIKNAVAPHYVYETKFYRLASYHRSVATLDGNVRTVGYLEDPKQIIPYLMLDHPDKKDLDELDFVFPRPPSEILYSGYFLLAFNVFLAVLPCFWKRLRPYRFNIPPAQILG